MYNTCISKSLVFFCRLIAYVGTLSVVGGVAPVLGAKGRASWRSGACTVGPVSSLIGSPNHSKKLPVLFFFCLLVVLRIV